MSKQSEFERGARCAEQVHMRRNGHKSNYSTGYVLGMLAKIGRSLNALYAAGCNGDLTNRQSLRQSNLEDKAAEYARELGARLYLQTDPRGGTVYLIFPGDIPEGQTVASCYTNGVFVA